MLSAACAYSRMTRRSPPRSPNGNNAPNCMVPLQVEVTPKSHSALHDDRAADGAQGGHRRPDEGREDGVKYLRPEQLRFVEPDGVEPAHIVEAKIFVGIVPLHKAVPDVVDLLP